MTLTERKAAALAAEAARRAGLSTNDEEASDGLLDKLAVWQDTFVRNLDEHTTFRADLARQRKADKVRLFGLINR